MGVPVQHRNTKNLAEQTSAVEVQWDALGGGGKISKIIKSEEEMWRWPTFY